MKNAKRTITDLNAPNGFRDIPFQSQEFEHDGRRHFPDFQPYFHLNMCLFNLFETFQAVRT